MNTTVAVDGFAPTTKYPWHFGLEAASPDKKYRWWLAREWDAARPRCCWVMLNPSTANAKKDDATIRRCVGFAQRWGYGAIDVVNLWGLRETNPKRLARLYTSNADLQGPGWLRYFEKAYEAELAVFAWGSCLEYEIRAREVSLLIRSGRLAAGTKPPMCLGRTKDGYPKHPVRLSYQTKLEPWA